MSDWPASHHEALKKHLAAGLSASQAAAELNAEFRTDRSRNAVIGHAKRTGVAFKRRRSESPLKPIKKPRRAITPPQRPDIEIRRANSGFSPDAFVARVVEVNSDNVPLLELAPNGCRWPSGDHPHITFCNDTRTCGSSYCAPHYRLSLGREYTIEDRIKYRADRRRKAAAVVSVLAQD